MFPAASLSHYSAIMVPSASTVAKKDSSAQQRFVAKQLITNQHQVMTKIALVIKKIFFCMRLRFLGGRNKMDITSQRFLKFIVCIKLFKEVKAINKKKLFEMIIIIISLTTNFIAEFHDGLYLLAAHSHSFQFFLLSFRVEHVENSLGTMSNKMCYPIGKKGNCIEHNKKVHL